jgi:hypothetical protein
MNAFENGSEDRFEQELRGGAAKSALRIISKRVSKRGLIWH